MKLLLKSFFKRFDGTLPLFLFIFTLIEQTYNIYILFTTRRVQLFLCSLLPLCGGPPLGCRAEIWTRACCTASRLSLSRAAPYVVSQCELVWSVFRIRDPVPFLPLDPGSGMDFFRIPDLGSRIPRPYFEVLFDNFLVKSSIILWKKHFKTKIIYNFVKFCGYIKRYDF